MPSQPLSHRRPREPPTAIATANTAYPDAASDAVAPRSSVRYSASQSAAAPSRVVAQMVTTPTMSNCPVSTRAEPGPVPVPGPAPRPPALPPRGGWRAARTCSAVGYPPVRGPRNPGSRVRPRRRRGRPPRRRRGLRDRSGGGGPRTPAVLDEGAQGDHHRTRASEHGDGGEVRGEWDAEHGRRGRRSRPRRCRRRSSRRGSGASSRGRRAARRRCRARSWPRPTTRRTTPRRTGSTPSATRVGTTARATSAAEAATVVAATTARLPNRRHQRPLNGIDSSDPNPGASSTSPSSAALAPSRSLVAGSRATHEASRNPLVAKTSAVASPARPAAGSPAPGRIPAGPDFTRSTGRSPRPRRPA